MTKQIFFVTSNKGKIASLNEYFKKFEIDVNIEPVKLDIVEPQANSVREVSKIKALEAFEQLKAPVIVEDGGLEIEALNGFPGVYVRYILDSIGVDGILKLMEGVKNRTCNFVSTATFVDREGNIHQFDRDPGFGEVVTEKRTKKSEFAWSDLWYIFYKPDLEKTLSEMTKEELYDMDKGDGDSSSLTKFAIWFKDNQNLV